MLVAIASGFVLALFAPFFRRAGWLLSLLPAALAIYFAASGPAVWRGAVLETRHDWAPALGVFLSFRLDGLSLLFALLITGIGAIIVFYGGRYLHGHRSLGRFYALLLFFMASMLGLVLADNLLVLYVFWELTGISSYLLIGFDHHREAARRAALQALIVTGAGGLALLAGIILLRQMAGTFEIAALAKQASAVRDHALYLPALALVLGGAFTKSAQFPFHFWLPAAMEAPTPVSAYLHAATMVKAGVYLLARLNPVLGGTDAWLISVTSVGALTMLAGGLLGLYKTDLKQILAYSTVSVLGILTFLAGLGTPLALTALAVYLLAHGMYKGALFLVAGIVDHQTGTREIARLGALWRTMPVTAAAALLAALSMAGLPPLLGFVGKEVFYEAGLDGFGLPSPFTAATAVTGALLFTLAGAAGFRPFLGRTRGKPAGEREAPVGLWLGPAILAAGGLLLGLAPALLIAPIRSAVLAMAPAGTHSVELALFHGLNPALYLSAASAAGGLVLYGLHPRLIAAGSRPERLWRWGPARAYELFMDALTGIARIQTRLLQSGYLRRYLRYVVLTTIGLAGFAILRGVALLWPPAMGARLHEVVVALVIVAGTIAAVTASSRLAAVASLGVVGVGVSLVFALFGAPDLAMTQLAVETLTVIVLVLVLYHLPDFSTLTGRGIRMWDAAVSLAGGGLMALLVLVSVAVRYAPAISSYYVDNSYGLAKGRNVVNVILTDFRALDTLGEITVIAMSALGVWALLRLRGGRK